MRIKNTLKTVVFMSISLSSAFVFAATNASSATADKAGYSATNQIALEDSTKDVSKQEAVEPNKKAGAHHHKHHAKHHHGKKACGKHHHKHHHKHHAKHHHGKKACGPKHHGKHHHNKGTAHHHKHGQAKSMDKNSGNVTEGEPKDPNNSYNTSKSMLMNHN